MNKAKGILLILTAVALFACTTAKPIKPSKKVQTGYLKSDISQAELSNRADYKRYFYSCQNLETGGNSTLSTYFPLSRESRLAHNFGIYFQLDGGKAEPFDHIANISLNAKGSRFEVIYRSYQPIQGHYIDLVASQYRSTYYKNLNGTRVPWLICKEL